jgi:phosphonate transport system substrate-binding protein
VTFLREKPGSIEPIAAPVLIGERYENKPIYFSDVIVNVDNSANRFADLKGATWAYNELDSQSGYGITRHHLLQMGATNGFFSRVICASSHQNAIQLVAKGKLDSTAIDSQVLAIELQNHPELHQQIRIIASLGPSTIQPMVAQANLPDKIKIAIREIVTQIHTDPIARNTFTQCGVEEFVPIQDRDYDDIRAMLQQAESANFLTFH